jgi:hypothetical protein
MFGGKAINYDDIKTAVEKITRRKGKLISPADLQDGDLVYIGENTSPALIRIDGAGDTERVSTYSNIWAYFVGYPVIGSSARRSDIASDIVLRRVATQADYPVPEYPHSTITTVTPQPDGSMLCQNMVHGMTGQTFVVSPAKLAEMKGRNDRVWVQQEVTK